MLRDSAFSSIQGNSAGIAASKDRSLIRGKEKEKETETKREREGRKREKRIENTEETLRDKVDAT